MTTIDLLMFAVLMLILLAGVLMANQSPRMRCPKCHCMMNRTANISNGVGVFICPVCKKYIFEDEMK